MKHRVLLALLLLVFSIPSIVFSESKTISYNNNQKGSRALQFRLSSDFTLTSFQGSAFSGQVFFRDNWAIRAGAGFTYGDEAVLFEQGLANDMDVYQEDQIELEEWSKYFSAIAQVLYYHQGEPLSLYFGFGPYFSYSSSRYDDAGFGFDGNFLYLARSASESTTREIGGELCFGVQLPVASRFAVHAEYSGRLIHNKHEWLYQYFNESEIESSYLQSREVNRWDIVSNGVRFGLSFYF